MKSELLLEHRGTLLAVADDPEILVLLSCVLESGGFRVLLASERDELTDLLDLVPGVDRVMIRAGMPFSEEMAALCSRRGLGVCQFSGIVQDRVLRLRLPGQRVIDFPRILIVLDNPAHRSPLERTLSEDGYLVTTVSGGQDAMAAVQTEIFDVAVVDCFSADSVEYIRHVHTEYPSVKVVALCESVHGSVSGLASTAGAHVVLERYCKTSEIRSAVYTLLDPVIGSQGIAVGVDALRSMAVG